MARLEGVTCAATTICRLRALPVIQPALVELVNLALAADDGFTSLLLSRHAPLLIFCRGQLSGSGAMMLIGQAIVAVGSETAHIPSSEDLRRLPRRGQGPFAEPQAWLDFVGSTARARTEAQRLSGRLAQLPTALLVMCQARLPAQSVNHSICVLGSLRPTPNKSAVGQRTVVVGFDAACGIALIELNDPERANVLSQRLSAAVD